MTHQTTGGYTLHEFQDGLHSYYCRSENFTYRALFSNSLEVLHFKNRNTCLLNYLLTYSMEQSPSCEASQFPGSQEIPHILWNVKVHYCMHMCLSPVPILCQLDPVHWSLSLRFPQQNPVYASPLPHTCYIPHQSPSSQLTWARHVACLHK
jgi:hypothetical protein